MTFSYSQISQFLRCPRSYRYRYLDGWREKESRAAMCFGRSFEKALAAFFEHEDAGAVLFKEWGAYRDVPLEYSHGDDWERLLRQGIALLEQFARDNRIRIRQPACHIYRQQRINTRQRIDNRIDDGIEASPFPSTCASKPQTTIVPDATAPLKWMIPEIVKSPTEAASVILDKALGQE